MTNSVTLKDVAAAAGVSIATASYVLRGTKTLGEQVEQRVRDAARSLGYRPNHSAQSLRTGLSYSLGLLVPDLTNPFFPALVHSLVTSARRHGYATILIDAENDPKLERKGFELLRRYGADGAAWIPVSAVPAKLESPHPPLVVVDRPTGHFDVAQADHAEGGRLLARHAIELGHRRVGLLSGPQDLSSAVERRNGFLEAAGDRIEIVWEREVSFGQELTGDIVALLRAETASLVVCANDTVAATVVQQVRQDGKDVPEHVSVFGFDDMPWSSLLNPALTTVRQPVAEIGAHAIELLLSRMANPSLPPRRSR